MLYVCHTLSLPKVSGRIGSGQVRSTHHVDDLLQGETEADDQRLRLIRHRPLQNIVVFEQVFKDALFVWPPPPPPRPPPGGGPSRTGSV